MPAGGASGAAILAAGRCVGQKTLQL